MGSNLYASILTHLKESRGVELDCPAFLQSLRPLVQQLRSQYRCSSSTESIGYESAALRAAYLLTYFPHHVFMAKQAFSSARPAWLQNAASQEMLQVLCVGGGPGPEVIGIAQSLAAVGLRRSITLRCLMLDRNAESWIEEDALIQRLMPSQVSVEVLHQQCDLLNPPKQEERVVPWLMERTEDKGFDIVFAQNVVNEVAGNPSEVQAIRYFRWFGGALAPKGVLVMADRYGPPPQQGMATTAERANRYSHCTKLVETICSSLELGQVVPYQDASMRLVSPYSVLPEAVESHLLTGEDGLLPLKNLYIRYAIYERTA